MLETGTPPVEQPAQWHSRMTFVLALAAAVVGLGNVWRFSYLTAEHGGGAFVILYLLCLFLLAVPVMIAEVVLGSYGRNSPQRAVQRATDRSLRSRVWVWIILPMCLAAGVMLSLYAVVAGWAMDFADSLQRGEFAAASVLNVADYYSALLADAGRQVYWLSLFFVIAIAIVWLGVRRGLGLLAWLLVPLMLALLGALVIFALDNGNLAASRDYLFSTQMLDFNMASLLAALKHAFYTLGVGAAVGICYGAYAPGHIPIGRTVVAVAMFDTLFSIAAGLAVFPVIFAHHLLPTAGPGLLFIAVPYAYGNTLAGELFGVLLFGLVIVSALGTAVALLEVMVSTLMQLLGWRRSSAVLLAGGLCWLLATLAVESLASTPPGQPNLFGLLDWLSVELLLPLGAFLVMLFIAWRMRVELLRAQLYRETDAFFSLWYALMRYIAPLIVAGVLMTTHWFSY
ncbi:MAG: sodium-dependent transporter [Parahaliea sp.]